MNSRPYRSDIDGLRAVAVASVVAFHAWPAAVPGGFVGVDVFFVISGYLITRIILAPDFSFVEFYCRRARRLLPALLIVLTTTLLLGAMILPPDAWRRLLGHAIGGGLFVANVVSYQDAGYFGGDADLRPLLHLWSLGVEEQFYLVWPAALLLGRRRVPVAKAIAFLGVVSFGAYLWLGEQNGRAAFFLPWSRLWELAAGALLINFEIPCRWAGAASVCGLGLIAGAIALAGVETEFPGLWLIAPVIGAGLIVASPSAGFNRAVLSSRGAVALGLISYPLYLWHWPLLSLLRNIDRAPPPLNVWTTIGISILLAAVTWRLVERPLVRFSLPRVAAALGAALSALMLVTTAARAAAPTDSNELTNAACVQRYPYHTGGLWFCMLSRERAPTVLLLGDSHAHHLYPGLAHALPNDSVLVLGACAPTLGLRFPQPRGSEDACANDNFARQSEYLRTAVLGQPTLRWVILSGMWRTFDPAGHEIDYWSGKPRATFEPRSPTALDAYVAAIGAQLDVLGDRPITLVLDGPRRGLGVKMQRQRQAPLRERLLALAESHRNVRVFDVMSALCSDEWCRWNRLRDANHLTHAASAEIAAAMVAQAAGARQSP
jgi:peptidoglycan/LPS O-acetylase OafA/YrhL